MAGSTLSSSCSKVDIGSHVVSVSDCFRALGRTHPIGHVLPLVVSANRPPE